MYVALIARRLPDDELSAGVDSLTVGVSGAVKMPRNASWQLSWEDDDVPMTAEEVWLCFIESTKLTASAAVHHHEFFVSVRRGSEESVARRRV